MEIITKFPQNWKVPVAVRDGEISEIFSTKKEAVKSVGEDNFREVENFVFKADLVPIGHTRRGKSVNYQFLVAGSRLILNLTVKAVADLLQEVSNGRIEVVGKAYRGLFDFQNYGGHVTCEPLSADDENRLAALAES